MEIEKKVTIGLIVAILVQTGGALVWAGAAAERISTVETELADRKMVSERLARVEAVLDGARGQLDRIERRMEARDE
jgi:sensor domain CHASE-containing protein